MSQLTASVLSRDRVRLAEIAVWFGYALLVSMAIALVWRHGLTMPYADGWNLVDVATGHAEPSLTWLWSLHNEHRLPLPRFVYLVAGRATGYDFRLMALANVAVLAAISAAWIVAMRRYRGRSSLLDLAVPALALHFGHEINLTWSFNFCLTTALATGALLVIAGARQPLAVGPALAVTVLAALLGGCGGVGLIYTPPLAAWLALCALGNWQACPRQNGRAAVCLAASVALVAMFLAYVYAFPRGHNAQLASPGVLDTFYGGLRFAVTSMGPVGRGMWPLGEVLVSVLLAGAAAIISRGLIAGGQRLTLAGLGLFLVAGLLLALTISHARAGGGLDDLTQTRYAIHSLPFLAATILAWDRYTRPAARRGFVVVAIVLLPIIVAVNDRKGLRDAEARSAQLTAMDEQIRSGATPQAIAARWSAYMQCDPQALAIRLERLCAAGLGPYRDEIAVPDEQLAERPRDLRR